jgi:hypothetical protein
MIYLLFGAIIRFVLETGRLRVPDTLFVRVSFLGEMHQVIVTVHAFFLGTVPGVEHLAVREHGSPFIGHFQKISVAFAALFVFETLVCRLPVFGVVVFGRIHGKVLNHIL